MMHSYYIFALPLGDNLVNGLIYVNKRPRPSFHSVRVKIQGTHAFNLYSVYFLPVGGDPVTDKDFIGEFMTDASGNANTLVRDCSSTHTPHCLMTRRGVNLNTVSGFSFSAAGQFLLYSRGPVKRDSDNDGTMDQWNTSDGTATGTFNNPILWGGSGYDGVQFITSF